MFHCPYIGQCPCWPKDCENCQVLLAAKAETNRTQDDDAQDAQPSENDGDQPRVDIRE